MEINRFADKQENYTDYEDREGDIPGLDKIGIRERPLKRFQESSSLSPLANTISRLDKETLGLNSKDLDSTVKQIDS